MAVMTPRTGSGDSLVANATAARTLAGAQSSPIHTVCVPVDASPHAAVALRPAQALAARMDAELLFVHAGPAADGMRDGLDGLVDTARARGLRARAVSVAAPGMAATAQAAWVAAVVREYDAGLVVVGTRDADGGTDGSTSLPRDGHLDGFAEAVLAQSPVPALLVGRRYGSRAADGALRWIGWEGPTLAARRAGHPMAPVRLVVAVDGSAAADRALAAAAALGRSLTARVGLVRVVPSTSVLYCARQGTVAAMEAAQRYLHGAAIRLQEAGIAPDAIGTAVRIGRAAEQLIGQAVREQASMLVIGNGDTTPLSARLAGSVTAAVVREAPLPVLVVPA